MLSSSNNYSSCNFLCKHVYFFQLTLSSYEIKSRIFFSKFIAGVQYKVDEDTKIINK
jgi:hypothetical protein